ncbi:tRNA-2-methylthio-N(6)-dimethylallyladenosine synthase [archaeon HR06]|nr:tRNA-2-methylthio-N(6)-dimethylallyladenosine synthase [archaeon HR06]
MRIIVKYFAIIRELVGKGEEEILFKEGNLMDVIYKIIEGREKLKDYLIKDGKINPRVKILVNGKDVPLNFNLKDGDVIALLPPVGGGSYKVYLEAYGCSASFSDAEMIMGSLEKAGYKLVKDMKEADLNLIVTCSVKSPTANRMYHRIKELSLKPLVVAGCLPKAERDRVERINPKASLLGPDSIDRVVEVVEGTLKGIKVVALEKNLKPKILLPRVRINLVIGIVEIASGCLSSCTFCQVKLVKGRLFSYPLELILEEVKSSLKEGCKEIWLTSTDCGCYGFDIKSNLGELVKKICKLEGRFMVRVGMMNPVHLKRRKILEELIDAYKEDKVFKFLHIPVQSGSNRILKLMKRGHTIEDFMEILDRFRSEINNLTVSTDIIVGFPTETEEDFLKTCEIIKEMDVINLNKYGDRPGTEASKMPKVRTDVIKARSVELHRLIRDVTLKKNQKWIGWRGEALIDERTYNGVIARNISYKPIVIMEEKNLGEWEKVRVIKATPNCLIGET